MRSVSSPCRLNIFVYDKKHLESKNCYESLRSYGKSVSISVYLFRTKIKSIYDDIKWYLKWPSNKYRRFHELISKYFLAFFLHLLKFLSDKLRPSIASLKIIFGTITRELRNLFFESWKRWLLILFECLNFTNIGWMAKVDMIDLMDTQKCSDWRLDTLHIYSHWLFVFDINSHWQFFDELLQSSNWAKFEIDWWNCLFLKMFTLLAKFHWKIIFYIANSTLLWPQSKNNFQENQSLNE